MPFRPPRAQSRSHSYDTPHGRNLIGRHDNTFRSARRHPGPPLPFFSFRLLVPAPIFIVRWHLLQVSPDVRRDPDGKGCPPCNGCTWSRAGSATAARTSRRCPHPTSRHAGRAADAALNRRFPGPRPKQTVARLLRHVPHTTPRAACCGLGNRRLLGHLTARPTLRGRFPTPGCAAKRGAPWAVECNAFGVFRSSA